MLYKQIGLFEVAPHNVQWQILCYPLALRLLYSSVYNHRLERESAKIRVTHNGGTCSQLTDTVRSTEEKRTYLKPCYVTYGKNHETYSGEKKKTVLSFQELRKSLSI
jgi:hypothetical protein